MYEALLLIEPSTALTIENLRAELAKFYKAVPEKPGSIQLSGSEIQLVWPDFTLIVSYSDSPHVIEESRAIAKQFAQAHEARERIQQCWARFEVAGNDDPAMEHFNDYLFIVEAAQRLGTVYAFDPISGEFI
jgi:hypothetical protein